MSYFNNLKTAINEGIEGKNEGLPTSLDRLDDFISIKRKMMITVFGATGSAKSTLVNQAFIMSPWEYCLDNKIPLKVIYFSMERSIIFTHGKQLINKIFRDTGELIDLPVLLGWYKNKKLDSKQSKYIDKYKEYFEKMEEDIEVYEGQKTPADIEEIIDKYANANGKEVKIGDKIIYKPNNPKEHVIIVLDHLGLISKGKHSNKKAAIDETIENLQICRDYYGYTIVNVSQVNRDLSKGNKEIFEPMLDHLKETGNIGEASDLVLSIFDPIRYHTTDMNYGDVERFRCSVTGHKYFRNIGILKNSYGIDGASIGCVFMGQTGIIKTLPKAKVVKEEWKDVDYMKIFSYKYFR